MGKRKALKRGREWREVKESKVEGGTGTEISGRGKGRSE